MANNALKRDLMARARRFGWTGTAYGKAKRFERMRARIAAENARLDQAAEELASRRASKPSRKRWWMR